MILTIDDVVGDPMIFCKPVVTWNHGKLALISAAVSGDLTFFLSTDSAPHSLRAKRGGAGDALGKCAAKAFSFPIFQPSLMPRSLCLRLWRRRSRRSISIGLQ